MFSFQDGIPASFRLLVVVTSKQSPILKDNGRATTPFFATEEQTDVGTGKSLLRSENVPGLLVTIRGNLISKAGHVTLPDLSEPM